MVIIKLVLHRCVWDSNPSVLLQLFITATTFSDSLNPLGNKRMSGQQISTDKEIGPLCICYPQETHNQGEIRKKELLQSCDVLGIPPPT